MSPFLYRDVKHIMYISGIKQGGGGGIDRAL